MKETYVITTLPEEEGEECSSSEYWLLILHYCQMRDLKISDDASAPALTQPMQPTRNWGSGMNSEACFYVFVEQCIEYWVGIWRYSSVSGNISAPSSERNSGPDKDSWKRKKIGLEEEKHLGWLTLPGPRREGDGAEILSKFLSLLRLTVTFIATNQPWIGEFNFLLSSPCSKVLYKYLL